MLRSSRVNRQSLIGRINGGSVDGNEQEKVSGQFYFPPVRRNWNNNFLLSALATS
jgi:hypothetical protein